jgi:hypothetical protein
MSVIRTVLAALILALGWATAVTAASLDVRVSDAGGVRIAVKPISFDPGAKSWDFEVSMDTHTKPLDQDLTRVSVLVDDTGRQHTPSGWKGDPPGGHHRKGVLQFAPVPGNPKSLEIRITGVGTPEARVFAWNLR